MTWIAGSGRCVLQGQVDKKNCPALSWSRGGAFLVVACTGKQEVAVYPESEITLEQSIESGHVLDMDKVDPIFQWKGGKGNLVMGNFSPDDLHFAFTGGTPAIHVANTTEWKVTHDVKVPVRPSFLHWVGNDHLLVDGKVEKQQPCPTIHNLRVDEGGPLAFLLEEIGEQKRLGFRVMDINSFREIGGIAPDVPDICDVVLPQQMKVGVITSTGMLLGDWNGHDGSNYKAFFKI